MGWLEKQALLVELEDRAGRTVFYKTIPIFIAQSCEMLNAMDDPNFTASVTFHGKSLNAVLMVPAERRPVFRSVLPCAEAPVPEL